MFRLTKSSKQLSCSGFINQWKASAGDREYYRTMKTTTTTSAPKSQAEEIKELREERCPEIIAQNKKGFRSKKFDKFIKCEEKSKKKEKKIPKATIPKVTIPNFTEIDQVNQNIGQQQNHHQNNQQNQQQQDNQYIPPLGTDHKFKILF